MQRVYDQPIDAMPDLRGPEGPWSEDEVLDQVLRLVADHHRALGLSIGRRVFSPSIAELRQSPLGRDLRLLAAASYGDALPAAAQAAAERVREILLRPLAAEEYAVPAWFWGSELGRIVARAERLAAGEGAYLSLAQAEAWLGVPAANLEAWLADWALPWLPDEAGVPLLRRSAVERLRIVALASARGPRETEDEVVIDERLSA